MGTIGTTTTAPATTTPVMTAGSTRGSRKTGARLPVGGKSGKILPPPPNLAAPAFQPPPHPSPSAPRLIARDGKPLLSKQTLCGCGCGQPCQKKRHFIQGHDSKLRSIILKVEQGEMLPPEAIADQFGRCEECDTLAWIKPDGKERERGVVLCGECRKVEEGLE